MIAASSRGARMKVDRGTSSPARTNASSAGTASAPIKQGNGRRHRRGERRKKLLGDFQVQAQPESEHPARGGGEHVVEKSKRGAVVGLKRVHCVCFRCAATRNPPRARARREAR